MPSQHKHPIIATVRGPVALRDAAKQKAQSEGTTLAALVRGWVASYVETGSPLGKSCGSLR